MKSSVKCAVQHYSSDDIILRRCCAGLSIGCYVEKHDGNVAIYQYIPMDKLPG